MSYLAPEQLDRPHLTRAVQWMVLAWVGVGLIQFTLVTPKDMVAWLGFTPAHVGQTWWTVVTYAFVHTDQWALALNLFILLAFGPRVEEHWGAKAFTVFYLWCVIGGAVTYAVFARTGALAGASAGVFGVMLAYSWLWPKEVLYLFGILPVRATTLVLVLTGVSLSLGIYDGNTTGAASLAYLGGFAFAILYLKRPNPVNIDQLRHRIAPAPDPTDETPRAIPRTLPRSRRADEVDEIVAQSKAVTAKPPARATPAATAPEAKQETVNRVLDKISEQGLDSLTADERQLLEDMSRRLRGR